MFTINHQSKKASDQTKILNVIKNDEIEQNINQINNTILNPLKIVNTEFVKNIKKTH